MVLPLSFRPEFDDDDAEILKAKIEIIFRADRMGNGKYVTQQLNLIETCYGRDIRRSIVRTLRQDRAYIKTHS